MHQQATTLFDGLWQHYLQVTPSAEKIHNLLGQQGEIINDHIALRTFNLPGIGLDVLAAHFFTLGYEAKEEYQFVGKKLFARHFEHLDPALPKVFISELLVEQCSPELQQIVEALAAQMDKSVVTNDDFLYSGRHWQCSLQEYKSLLAESEYAAWMAAWGYRANHFTVSVNHLPAYPTLASVNEALKQAGFALNSSGGEIKGSPGVLLEQSSTLADQASVLFSDGKRLVPSCFYEFALRYPMANGELYTGFVAASADKIFESTDVR
ncbi:DUF1338 domain-containing protein [Corallincola spongiicola]|uniref:2-oxoadipate dioxygenase/decarboxylase n=1 Tax=Corallincola spongiicola TaxID=2520508 RepID=A0ABY1WQJ7_9GAMM|nr:DUF1338 domain-containing protein [Corallincola spongiicola]TAA46888.1 DUF1338 domain-containing protein [Corallincola spongiicola]